MASFSACHVIISWIRCTFLDFRCSHSFWQRLKNSILLLQVGLNLCHQLLRTPVPGGLVHRPRLSPSPRHLLGCRHRTKALSWTTTLTNSPRRRKSWVHSFIVRKYFNAIESLSKITDHVTDNLDIVRNCYLKLSL